MKILLLTDGIYPFQLGGMQKHSAVMLRLLAENGVHVHVFHPGGRNYSREAFDQQFHPELQKTISENVIAFPSGSSLPGHYLRENKRYSKRCFEAVRSAVGAYDLIYAQGFTAWHFLKMKRKGFTLPPVVVNFHGYGEFQKPPGLKVAMQYAMLRPAIRFNVRNADYVYSFGGKIDRILERIGVPANRILAQVNGIEESWLVSTITQRSVSSFVFIGRPEERKGIREIYGALSGFLKDQSMNLRFHFVGAFPQHMKLNDSRVIYHGELSSQEKIREVLDSCDCLVCPSYAEGMPTVVLEAMARGLLIVATDVGAISRQIDGNGILLARPDVQDLRNAMRMLMQKPVTEISSMKERSVQLVRERFLWSRVIESKLRDFERIKAKG